MEDVSVQVLTVSQLVQAVDEALADFDGVVVEGEVTDFRIIHDKWVTFSLKDTTSSVGCFMTLWNFKRNIEDGMMVRAVGRPRLRDKGFFSFVLESVQPTGEGALRRAYELLKKQLSDEGLFDDHRKRALPAFPQHIALITSKEAAAYTDFLKMLRERQGGMAITFIRTQVQGDDAPRQLLSALERANTELHDLDAVVMTRGGGSMEDLVAFNDESLVRAVAASRAPIVVGVGHERDVTLAELAADVRASTPSNAAELLVRSREEVLLEVGQLQTQLRYRFQDRLAECQRTCERLTTLLRGHMQTTEISVSQMQRRLRDVFLQRWREEKVWCDLVEDNLRQTWNDGLVEAKQQLEQQRRVLMMLSPEAVLKRGYSIVTTENGALVTDSKNIAKDDRLRVKLARGTLTAVVTKGNDS